MLRHYVLFLAKIRLGHFTSEKLRVNGIDNNINKKYDYWEKDNQPGGILMIPTQVAYTYSLRLEFIKLFTKVMMLEKGCLKELD